MAFCSVHKACADALFGEAQSRGMALVTGKTMMDRNALPAVHDDATTGAQGFRSALSDMAWQGPLALCDYAALCHHLDAKRS